MFQTELRCYQRKITIMEHQMENAWKIKWKPGLCGGFTGSIVSRNYGPFLGAPRIL